MYLLYHFLCCFLVGLHHAYYNNNNNNDGDDDDNYNNNNKKELDYITETKFIYRYFICGLSNIIVCSVLKFLKYK